MPGAVLETEDQPACDLIAVSDLREVTFGDRVAFEIAQNEKAVDQAFAITHLYRCRRHGDAGDDAGGNQKDGAKLEAQEFGDPVDRWRHGLSMPLSREWFADFADSYKNCGRGVMGQFELALKVRAFSRAVSVTKSIVALADREDAV